MTHPSLLPEGAIAIDTTAARLVAGYETTANGKIGHLRFNLPEKHNVIDLEGWQGIPYVMQQLAVVEDIRLIILRGIGGRTFVAGADISQFEEVLAGPEGTEFDIATVSAFDAKGFEHSVANIFMIPLGIMHAAEITLSQFLTGNLLPVTLGNIVGGMLCVMAPFGTSFGGWLKKKEE